MNSYQRNDDRGVRPGRTGRLFVATAIVICLFGIDTVSGGLLRGYVRTTSTRIWSAGKSVWSSIAGSGFFSSRRVLQFENDALKQKIAQLQIRAGSYGVLLEENMSLKRMARLASLGPGITAPVVSSLLASPYGTFLVEAGSADGVTVGSLVLAGDGESGSFVVGSVAEVGKRVSLVTEVFAPYVSSEVTIRGAPLSVLGQGGGNARGDAPQALAIAEGDPVFSSRFAGRSVGVVGATREDSTRTYQTIYIRLPVSLSALQYVYVVLAQ